MTFTDDFTGSVDQLITDRTGWSLVGTEGAFQGRIYSNGSSLCVRQLGSGSGPTVYFCTDQGTADHYIQYKRVTFGTFATNELVTRYVDASNYISHRMPGTGSLGSRLSKMVAGVRTELVQVQGAANDVNRIECDGSSVSFYINGVQQGSTQTVTDHQTETSQGFTFFAIAYVDFIDDFAAGAMGGGDTVTVSSETSGSSSADISSIVQDHLAASVQTAVAAVSDLSTITQSGETITTAAESAVAGGSDIASVSQAHLVIVDESGHAQSIDPAAIVQNHLAVSLETVVWCLADDSVASDVPVAYSDKTHIAAGSDVSSISQTHLVIVDDSGHAQSIDPAAIVQNHQADAVASIINQTIDSGQSFDETLVLGDISNCSLVILTTRRTIRSCTTQRSVAPC